MYIFVFLFICITLDSYQPIVISGGNADGIKSAVEKITKIVHDIEESMEKTVIIPRQYHRALIGPGGHGLQSMLKKVDGRVRVSFPKEDCVKTDEENKVLLKGPSKDVNTIEGMIVNEWKSLELGSSSDSFNSARSDRR